MQRALQLLALVSLCACTRENEARPVPKEAKPVAPPAEPKAPPKPKATLTRDCTVDSDCVMTTRDDDCCDHCGNIAVNAVSLARLNEYCAQQTVSCAPYDCPFQPATAHCEKGSCVRRVK